MKLKLVLALTCALVASATGCSRNRQEAVILANQADKEVALNPEGAASKYEQATKLDPTSHAIFFKLATGPYHKDFIQTPLPLLVVMFGLVGILAILMGFLAEMLVRIYHETQRKPVFAVAEVASQQPRP